ncbi:MAG: 5-oxoprolinase subunit C family protein, partial [Gemmatimonadaceae bacterium]
LEWAGGSGAVRCDGDLCLALAGADVDAAMNGRPVPTGRTIHATAGSLLEVRRVRSGHFLYLAVAGAIAVPTVLGGAGTYLPAGLGGLEGRRLRAGDVLPVGYHSRATPPAGFTCPPGLMDPVPASAGVIRVVRGPQAAMLDDDGWAALLGGGFRVGTASDRMGYRLSGEPVVPAAPRDLPSEPACAGAIQLPPGGQPIVLMADAPTVGGYPKPAVVCRSDLGRLAQCPPGSMVRFALVELAEAQRLYRRRRVAAWTLGELATRNG